MKRALPTSLRRPALACAAGLLAVLSAGCFNPFDPRIAPNRGVSKAPPLPTSAEGVVQLFDWCWDNQAIAEYEEIFTDDFRFQFASTDTAGNSYREHSATREDEIEIARHLLVGGSATEPPANKITLTLDQNLIPQQDGRPGKLDFKYHRLIVTQVVLSIDTEGEDYNVTGVARFFVIRGDSALIPAAMFQKGFRSDSLRWYIDRWEDETVGGTLAQAAAIRAGHGTLSLAPRSLADAAPMAAMPRIGRREGSEGGPPAPSTSSSAPLWVSWGYVKRAFDPRH